MAAAWKARKKTKRRGGFRGLGSGCLFNLFIYEEVLVASDIFSRTGWTGRWAGPF
jgi:hypothetical protein